MTTGEARDSMNTFFNTNYALITPDVGLGLSPLPTIYWDNLSASPPGTDVTWVEFSVTHNQGTQDTLGAVGNRKFKKNGLVTIRIKAPNDAGLDATDYLMENILAFMEGGETADGIAMNNVTPSELGNIGSWFQTDILATFEYEKIR
jgi:hypothetical protein